MGLGLGPGVSGSYQNNDDDGNSNTATIYCLGDGLGAFLQGQDPFVLPLGWPHLAVGQRAALWNLVSCGCWEVTGLPDHVAGVISSL